MRVPYFRVLERTIKSMSVDVRALLGLVILCAVSLGHAAASELQWKDATSLEIEGKGWAKTAGPFDRLPDSAQPKVNEVARAQSKDSAGICIRFVTEAPSVSVRWSLRNVALDMPHMPATGCSGLDLYSRVGSGAWRFVGNCRPGKQEGNLASIEFADGGKANRECLLYLPLYNGTTSLEIGVPPGSHLDKPPARPDALRKPIVIYGTSITQGGCASRPGMVWTSILGRMLDRPVINLGFSASGDMAAPVGEVLAELDPAVYLIDCAWNMGDSQDVYFARTTQLVQTLRKAHPVTPILFIGQSLIRPEAHPTELTRRQEVAVQRLQKEGVEGLMMIGGTDLIGTDGEGTVDGVHYNDIGMQRQAQYLFPIVSKVLSEPTTTTSAKPRVYIDTDMAAEVDDPYAVFRALVAPELNVVGLSAMGWDGPLDFVTNTHASQKMNEEVLAILKLTDRVSHPIGSLHAMKDATTPVESPAARDIIAKAKETPAGQKLHLFTLGAYTTVASALLIDPSIKDKVAVYVMGYLYKDGRLIPDESNTMGDLHAAGHLLKCGVELHVMPNTSLRKFQWSKADMDSHFKGRPGVPDKASAHSCTV
ncbi:Inosine-uridine preferring nucleoside hydrolase [Singulisphaera sp. GP187]|uniref:SGNH/GDSL hydrolase family protein n=1 Tax=Singulisphaera sp. GP187 TaxID=1882752 RepID=UPI0009270B86|nr:SGNH/GDSL hydrolase family protein [Singulisphaera sp. GP187]SIO16889.1 Inosine-uridine preferring nucleoside hydrolase [Singulisphaera sp. GP187]